MTNPFTAHPAERHVKRSGGDLYRFRFANGYGASVIDDGYGADQGLWELAVLGYDGHLTYETPITDDVIGCQSVKEIAELLRQVADLPAAS